MQAITAANSDINVRNRNMAVLFRQRQGEPAAPKCPVAWTRGGIVVPPPVRVNAGCSPALLETRLRTTYHAARTSDLSCDPKPARCFRCPTAAADGPLWHSSLL